MAAAAAVFQVFGLEMLQKYIQDVAYVAMIIYACCMRMFSSVSGFFRLLFQVFHLDVAKVYLDVAYVAMTKYACCKPMFQVFQVF